MEKISLFIFSIRGFPYVPILNNWDTRSAGFKRYVMPFSACSLRRHSGFGASVTVSRTTLSKVEGEWAVRNQLMDTCVII